MGPSFDDNLDYWVDEDGHFCSICDGLNHGYPGGPPCPLEVDLDLRDEVDADERRYG